MEWTQATTKPTPGLPVIIFGLNSYGKKRRLRACWLPKYFEEINGESDGDEDYHEEKDCYYWPEGWYEWNEFDETNWLIDFDVLYWINLPEYPKV